MAGMLPDRSVVDSHHNDFLTCGICQELFTDPRILPCLHSFCFKCICTHQESHQSEHRPPLCPECREPISVEADSFKKNFFINGLAELVRSKRAKSMQCTPCGLKGRSSPAEMKCLNCGDGLCTDCSDGHNASTQTHGHQIVSVADLREGLHDETFRRLQRIQCQQHQDKDVEYFCQSCHLPVCIACVILLHKDHNTQPITEAVSPLKSMMKSKVEIIRKKFKEVSKQEMSILSLTKALKIKRELETSRIEENAEREIAKIKSRQHDSLRKLSTETKEIEKEHNTMLQELSQQKNRIGSCVDFCDSILETGKDDELLMLKTTIMDRLQQLKGHAMAIHKTDALTVAKDDEQNEKQDEMQDIRQTPQSEASVSQTRSIPSRYNMKFQRTFSAKFKGDTKNPNIKGTAYSFGAGLLISDLANKKVKMINSCGKLKQEITVDGFYPRAIAVAGDIIAVVSENYLCIFTLKGHLRTKVKLNKNKPDEGLPFTYSLAASDDVGIVVGNIPGDKRLHVYDLDGTMKRYLDCNIRFPLASLSVTPERDIVMSEWGSGSLRVLSSGGKDRWSSREYDTGWKPNGTCVSRDGTIFVADYDWGGVRVYSSSGKKCLQYKTIRDGLHYPSHVAFDEEGSLYVIDAKDRINKYTV
ncbi:E3 ubiquitin-protein ligase TRIM56-like [Haliotis cracherodii]|uniref:E3 ubiquitin-protein ligase TRIM56-like n=1 Tax=Haliotis cracherodii TaxID=6455 RepID=UPI0039EAAB0D